MTYAETRTHYGEQHVAVVYLQCDGTNIGYEENPVTENEFFSTEEAQEYIKSHHPYPCEPDTDYTFSIWEDADEYLDDCIRDEMNGAFK